MRRFIIILLIISSGFFLYNKHGNHAESANLTKKQVRVLHIEDGDTIKVIYPDSQRKTWIRLYGIDCPEYDPSYSSNQRYGKAATSALSPLKGRKVLIREMGKGKYGRTIGIVFEDNSQEWSLNAKLVGNGLAWVYDKYCTENICKKWKELEARARKQRINIWNQASPKAPWIWRK